MRSLLGPNKRLVSLAPPTSAHLPPSLPPSPPSLLPPSLPPSDLSPSPKSEVLCSTCALGTGEHSAGRRNASDGRFSRQNRGQRSHTVYLPPPIE